jgi:hypothetical protein
MCKLHKYICLAKYFHKSVHMLVFNKYFYKSKKLKVVLWRPCYCPKQLVLWV